MPPDRLLTGKRSHLMGTEFPAEVASRPGGRRRGTSGRIRRALATQQAAEGRSGQCGPGRPTRLGRRSAGRAEGRSRQGTGPSFLLVRLLPCGGTVVRGGGESDGRRDAGLRRAGNHDLPPVCVQCGARRDVVFTPRTFMRRSLIPAYGLLFAALSMSRTRRVTVEVPLCPAHSGPRLFAHQRCLVGAEDGRHRGRPPHDRRGLGCVRRRPLSLARSAAARRSSSPAAGAAASRSAAVRAAGGGAEGHRHPCRRDGRPPRSGSGRPVRADGDGDALPAEGRAAGLAADPVPAGRPPRRASKPGRKASWSACWPRPHTRVAQPPCHGNRSPWPAEGLHFISWKTPIWTGAWRT